MNWREMDHRLQIALGAFAFFGLVVIYAIEIPYFNRYFSLSRLLMFGVLFGMVLGIAGAWFWSRRLRDTYDRMRLWVGLIVAGILFGPLFFSLINRHLDPFSAAWENVELVEMEERYSSRYGTGDPDELVEANSFNLYFYRNAELKRIVFSRKPNIGDSRKGELIGIKVRHGLLGMEWVQTVRPDGPKMSWHRMGFEYGFLVLCPDASGWFYG